MPPAFGLHTSFEAPVDTRPSRFKPTFFHSPLLPLPNVSLVTANVVPSPGAQVSPPVLLLEPLLLSLLLALTEEVVAACPPLPPAPIGLSLPPQPTATVVMRVRAR